MLAASNWNSRAILGSRSRQPSAASFGTGAAPAASVGAGVSATTQDAASARAAVKNRAIHSGFSPVISESSLKNAFLRGLLIPQFTGTLWYPSSKPSSFMR